MISKHNAKQTGQQFFGSHENKKKTFFPIMQLIINNAAASRNTHKNT
jgi:hypothetical protein